MPTDPYKYFRVEARELLDGLTEGVLEIEKGRADHDRITSMLRLAHTLKGAARVVKRPAMADLAHGMEDLLAPYREEDSAVPKERAVELLAMLDQIGTGLADLEPPSDRRAPVAARPSQEERLETVRVEVEEVDVLLGHLSEVGTEFARIENLTEALQRAKRLAGMVLQQLQPTAAEQDDPLAGRGGKLTEQLVDTLHSLDRRLSESVERIAREFSQARELANRMRLLPAATIFPPLTRLARDAAVTLDKQVQFDPSGGDIRLDAQVLTIVRDAMVQLVRNAVAHGIESQERRASAGKPACGRVELRIERRGNRVAFLCRDDGAGLDLGAIRRVAIQRGAISAAQAESFEIREAIELLLRGGFSTSGRVDEISGRGIGLDIVRATVTRLKAEISVETAPGLGTSVEISVPVSLVSALALRVASGGVIASLPLDCVRQTIRVEDHEIARCGTRESIAYERQAIPFLRLSTALGMEDSTLAPRKHCSMVIVAAGTNLAAIGVDRLIGTATVLVRALPALAPVARTVNGATLDNEGNPELFLDPAGLVEAAGQDHRQLRTRDTPAALVLVIDDSLTTRMVEQGILESAGYQVEVATSGEEALEMALTRHYSLFLVDVEMPGMDGFQFVSRTRAHPLLRDVPAVLVTSRASAEDQRRGEEAGARAYIVKSEFDQNHFLKTIQQLVAR